MGGFCSHFASRKGRCRRCVCCGLAGYCFPHTVEAWPVVTSVLLNSELLFDPHPSRMAGGARCKFLVRQGEGVGGTFINLVCVLPPPPPKKKKTHKKQNKTKNNNKQTNKQQHKTTYTKNNQQTNQPNKLACLLFLCYISI